MQLTWDGMARVEAAQTHMDVDVDGAQALVVQEKSLVGVVEQKSLAVVDEEMVQARAKTAQVAGLPPG
jgi:hypothetical protein